MKISGRWQRMIVLAAIYVILLITMILSSIWKWHDTTNVLLHSISRLTIFFIVFGLLFWFGERWKYSKIIIWIVFVIVCVFATTYDWQKGYSWGSIVSPILFLWGLYSLKEEIVKLRKIDDTQDASNEVLSGSKK